MFNDYLKVREIFGADDKKRDMGLETPENIERFNDISYGTDAKYNLLDVYRLIGSSKRQPTIVSVHGGAWVYGDKDAYQHYCMNLAKRGFTVVNFSYRLAPENKFPSTLEDINSVFKWIRQNDGKYSIDENSLFVVGDSAGAQIASQYGVILSNKDYSKFFDFDVPNIKIRAMALNCGSYNLKEQANDENPLIKLYLGDAINDTKMLDILSYIDKNYPPCIVTTAYNDFLKSQALPMHNLLKKKGVISEFKLYGDENSEHIGHVFHLNVREPLADVCNDEQINFFKKFI